MPAKDALPTRTSQSNPTYSDGWRSGKPVEDPEKMKKWGFVSAKPSEYLICLKNGKINSRRSGQGTTVFKYPWESIAIVPTSLQQVDFVADQVTLEKIGVSVTGLAVYRIVNPELAYRVLNFSYVERASEKLARTMREMFVGAARRLIANLTLEDCLTRRKEAIATFLMQEISPVVSGRGSPEDETDQGWGVVLDTIEIQDVRILSGKVFEDLQAPFRAELASRAELAELDRERELSEKRADSERRIAESALQSQRDTRLLKARTESEAAEFESAELLKAELARATVLEAELSRRDQLSRKQVQVDQEIAIREANAQSAIQQRKRDLEHDEQLSRLNLEQQRELTRLRIAQERELNRVKVEQEARVARIALAQEEELAKIRSEESRRAAQASSELTAIASENALREEQHKQQTKALQESRERELLTIATRLEILETEARQQRESRLAELSLKRQEAELAQAEARLNAELENLVSHGKAVQALVTTGLPEVAKVLQGAIGPIQVTHFGGTEAPLSHMAALVGQGMGFLRGFAASSPIAAPVASTSARTTDVPPSGNAA